MKGPFSDSTSLDLKYIQTKKQTNKQKELKMTRYNFSQY